MKPSIPKGTRDFSPTEMARRNFILNTIKTVYERYGFQQIETPAMENLSTLEGKYGDEGDKLLFRILNSGPVVDDIKVKSGDIKVSDIAEKGLRYDLTVPFARYVVMHQNEITFPFKRYQVQPVWRADRPQKGRYREFYQCDADVIGSTSLLNEVELIQIIDDVFTKFGIGINLLVNNRKILLGIAEYCGCPEKFYDITTALDKWDKIGVEGVTKELVSKGFSLDKIERIFECVNPTVDIEFTEDLPSFTLAELLEYEEDIDRAKENLPFINSVYRSDYGLLDCLFQIFKEANIEVGLLGVNEYKNIISALMTVNPNKKMLNLDLSLARGLNYYTGAIFEVKVNDSRSTFTSSILGGGRYDDLTGIFGLPNVSGVGISFGIDRIYDVMLEMNLFEQLQLNESTTKVLFVNFGKEEEKYSLNILSKLRSSGINSEIYPDAAAKMKKQMSYADAKKIPYVVLIGTEEMQTGKLTLKNMQSGEQEKVSLEELINKMK